MYRPIILFNYVYVRGKGGSNWFSNFWGLIFFNYAYLGEKGWVCG